MKICVADDEKEVRESIIHKLRALYPQDEIYDVEFGRKALRQIAAVNPDLVFLDIRMPEMDGLDILQSIKQRRPSIQAAMLSGYDDFVYARKSLHLGAIDYLLKPADREELRAVVERVKSETDKAFGKEIDIHLGRLSAKYVFIDTLRYFNTSLWFDERREKTVLFGHAGSLHRQLEETPKDTVFTFCVNHDYEGAVVVRQPVHRGPFFQLVEHFVPAVLEGIDRWESERFFGRPPEGRSHANTRRTAGRRAAQLRRQIMATARTGSHQRLEQSLNEWLECLYGLDLSMLRKECVNLMALLDEGLAGGGEVIVLEEEKIHYWTQWVSKHRTWGELSGKIRKFVLDGIRALTQPESQSHTGWFQQALHMLDTSADPNLSLELVAEAVGVHSVTLSRIFKQQTGMNFVRYLVRNRLRLAQKLLLNSEKNINDIAEEVGYVDYRYFRTLFKKEFGMTPSEYRRSNGIAGGVDEVD
ncbi:transcriptional regulator [Paenibacillus darwinianus]|uniref:Transcriptional regulator n=1 Tax=Paenibacillus darwinianus TaxID=1380763 RepID=A0A9W5W805_9BACL|nr:helix-turn-helix domain-containing protein [Paenibacillus darwinianus]EXX89492.1 transcriptional regulator [Paenibacillus darwinianus]EXX91177.1 transcriptional regulator [Paenibacillus darwinianus]EXX92529.1 transcriptional regulator [Paenibacillus darwinianus]